MSSFLSHLPGLFFYANVFSALLFTFTLYRKYRAFYDPIWEKAKIDQNVAKDAEKIRKGESQYKGYMLKVLSYFVAYNLGVYWLIKLDSTTAKVIGSMLSAKFLSDIYIRLYLNSVHCCGGYLETMVHYQDNETGPPW